MNCILAYLLHNWKVVYRDKWDLSDWNDVWLRLNSNELDHSGKKLHESRDDFQYFLWI